MNKMKQVWITVWLIAGGMAMAEGSDPVDPLHERLKGIAQAYTQHQLVNPWPQVAPTKCWVPPPGVYRSRAEGEHGGKLFYLFAKDAAALRAKEARDVQAVGQFLVKETWAAVEPDAASVSGFFRHPGGQTVSRMVTDEGKVWVTGEQQELYLMLKQAPDTPDTDQGWTYAVLSRDGKTVHKAGRIQSCIDCHEDAKHDRILGTYAPQLPLRLPIEPSK